MRRSCWLLAAALVLPAIAGCTGRSCNDAVPAVGPTPYTVADDTGTTAYPAGVDMSISGPIGR